MKCWLVYLQVLKVFDEPLLGDLAIVIETKENAV